MPRNFDAPKLLEKELESLKHESLEVAKEKLIEAFDNFEAIFEEHPEARLKNIVFGELNRYEWRLFHRKHFNHPFSQFGLL